MEHSLSDLTINKLEKFTEFIEIHSKDTNFLESLKYYEKYNGLQNTLKSSNIG